MKIILSRKGFDSGTGGCPSPIFPDGRLSSLPIPGRDRLRYEEITSPHGALGDVVLDLSGGAIRPRSCAHLDPDIDASVMPRLPGWLPSLGQVDAAQSHLAGQGVGVGDVFVFFGWFRPVEQSEGRWRYVRAAPEQHVMFGYLQVGEILPLGAQPDTAALLRERPWLEGHPHVEGERSANNTLYIASKELVINGVSIGVPGGGAFTQMDRRLVLTAPGASKSVWAAPEWLMPGEEGPALSYHRASERWSRAPDGTGRLQSVAKGQEFVVEPSPGKQEAAVEWLRQLVAPMPELTATVRRRRGP